MHEQCTTHQVLSTVQELYGRGNSGDMLYVFLVLVNAYVKPIPQVCCVPRGCAVHSDLCALLPVPWGLAHAAALQQHHYHHHNNNNNKTTGCQ